MQITGEVIFRAFFGKSQILTKEGLLLSEELAQIIFEISEISTKANHIVKLSIFGYNYERFDFLLNKK